jgi:hypothetical protein
MCIGARRTRMPCMFMTGSGPLDAERAFNRQLRSRRRAVRPPISVVAVGDSRAIPDGRHRVSVAKARGALTIDATIDTAA